MDHVAKSLRLDPGNVKALNMYKQGDISYIVRAISNYKMCIIIIFINTFDFQADPKGMPLQYCSIKDLWSSKLKDKYPLLSIQIICIDCIKVSMKLLKLLHENLKSRNSIWFVIGFEIILQQLEKFPNRLIDGEREELV